MAHSKSKRNQAASQKPQTLRIIGGKLRGSVLAYHGDPLTRPMKERVREATFNLLGPQIKETLAIDLFAGTGALGLEAISRGASAAVMIERHFPTVSLIRRNAEHLKLTDRVKIVAGDTFFWCLNPNQLERLEFSTSQTKRWTIFCSPPYRLYSDQASQMQQLLDVLMDLAPVGSVMVVEADEHFDPSQLPPPTEWDQRIYSPAHLYVGEKA